jgi:hypothetical protein
MHTANTDWTVPMSGDRDVVGKQVMLSGMILLYLSFCNCCEAIVALERCNSRWTIHLVIKVLVYFNYGVSIT